MVTDEELNEWEALAAAATPGPWVATRATTYDGGKAVVSEMFVRRPGGDVAIASDIIDPDTTAVSEANAAVIAAARTALPALVAEVRRLKGERARCERIARDFAVAAKVVGEASVYPELHANSAAMAAGASEVAGRIADPVRWP